MKNLAIYTPTLLEKQIAEITLKNCGHKVSESFQTGDYYTYNDHLGTWSRTDHPLDAEVISPFEIVDNLEGELLRIC